MPYTLKVTKVPHFGRFSAEFFRPFGPSLMFWGAGAGVAVSLFMSPVPIFQRDVLHRFPFLKDYFTDKTPDCDKPF
ncbi:uncharacterized protein EHS24_007520 [Apiotrichum porosum]|uniref:Uncharacterized protein n=1 Tax=Apiotrichum porosum TaxID=105984 RepID=A0A427XUL9_9TREE|nr:uncharacterized protein EHS24_007520 [Apiotrichum porosum]RSH82540.1 hypothetical protein EHS24_007520 [Apiotrichum porosum]